ncbi:gliding motility-associated C-terminal domain-containing protein [Mucilaginibacter glaciei]|uniref:Gliding motility-associated C-terminal domain-containing protein n=1 Tax=Mucilaginibacter glaciei TaxID=2772109 RepID=A0A926NQQ4_9SPHI|nr:gliding motility-associated C-terminal domain-containing protein [Mucilaginibacter glaciei]MBD1394246.1 gliding motility-associated C-terminal domain-containing protein [Mucilaginibacter glaciei]
MKFKSGSILILLILTSIYGVNAAGNKVKSSINYAKVIDDCPEIDDSHVNLIAANCGGANDGKILGIVAKGGTGTYHYTWYDSNKQIVGTAADLINVPAGNYYLQVRDDSKCAAATSQNFTVKVNLIVIDNTNTIIKPTACGKAFGSIISITTTNATSFVWTNSSQAVIGTALDLKNVPAGIYKLTATNNLGCIATSSYSVTNDTYFPTLSNIDTVPPLCGGNGGFKLTFLIKETDPGFNWELTPSGRDIQTGFIASSPNSPGVSIITLANMTPSDTYTLRVFNNDGCETYYNFKLNPVDFRIDASHVVIHNDYCGRHIGTIVGLKAIGISSVIPSPYRWRNEAGEVVGGLLFLAAVPAGKYTLTMKDPYGPCIDVKEFIIKDSTTLAEPPKVDDIKLCLPATTMINIINPDTSGYNLYDSTETLIATNKFGVFPVKVAHTSKYYVTHLTGTCESTKVLVNITVSLPGVSIPNAFTPNRDGVNDKWIITNLDQYPGSVVSVFSRGGQLVFNSTDYATPFDGRYKGRDLPDGVYYYLIDPKKPECTGQISGSLTIIR